MYIVTNLSPDHVPVPLLRVRLLVSRQRVAHAVLVLEVGLVPEGARVHRGGRHDRRLREGTGKVSDVSLH